MGRLHEDLTDGETIGTCFVNLVVFGTLDDVFVALDHGGIHEHVSIFDVPLY